MTDRRTFLHLLGGTALAAGVVKFLPVMTFAETAAAEPNKLHVLAAPGCGCCHAWADLARAQGYEVTVTEFVDTENQKSVLGIPEHLTSCHTVLGGDYIFEGHVPLDALAAVLQERPAIAGLAVPGMPVGSPGMGDDASAKFDVIAFGGEAGEEWIYYRAGSASPFAG